MNCIASSTKNKTWFVYIVQCSDNSLYTGITTDCTRRVKEHNQSKKGAKYTRNRRPVTLIYWEKFKSRSEASIREAEIKKMSADNKKRLIMYNKEHL